MTVVLSEDEDAAQRHPMLTEMEITCLQLSANGWARKEIAAELHVHAGTVQRTWHIAAIKLGADNIKHALAMAMRRGIIK